MEEFLKELGITKQGRKNENGFYVIDIDDSDEFGKIFSKLDKSDLVDEDEESSSITLDSANITYLGDDYTITLMGDFENDTDYKLVMREN